MTTLPADAHVHSEWSWDAGSDPASAGSMARICERAVRIGLPAVIFTGHLDFEDAWRVDDGDIGVHAQQHVEFGQPHLWDAQAAALLSSGSIDRVNGSLHMLPFDGSDRTEPTTLYRYRSADAVMWAYLEELLLMVGGSDSFEVLTHIDYAVRSWPTAEAGPFDPHRFEDGFRSAMRAIAESGRALEMNTRRLWPWIPQWWAEEGGRAVSFGSDAHGPESLAGNFPEAMAMVAFFGFAPGNAPDAFWTR